MIRPANTDPLRTALIGTGSISEEHLNALRTIRSATPVIHYITTNGIGNAWVAAELRVMEREGIPWVLHSMRSSGGHLYRSSWARDIERSTRLIYPLPSVATVLSILLAIAIFRGRFVCAFLNALFGKRESLRARIAGIAHFFVACHWARTIRQQEVSHIHSQWIHSCGTIGMYGAWLLNVPFSFTGHAVDLFRDRVALEDKIRRAAFIVCISTFHREFYLSHGARPEQLILAYCGVDVSHFQPKGRQVRAGKPVRILSSGRLVEKKGFRYLIETCRLLSNRGEQYECTIAGSGPLEETLRKQVSELGLSDRITVTGKPITQETLPEFMRSGDIYCLPCVWASDGDVDGLPQMLMEAMACGLPVISTPVTGIPDLVIDGETGLLVQSNDAEQLADALYTLLRDRQLRQRLAHQGRAFVTEQFNIKTSLDPLVGKFRSALGTTITSTVVTARPEAQLARSSGESLS